MEHMSVLKVNNMCRRQAFHSLPLAEIFPVAQTHLLLRIAWFHCNKNVSVEDDIDH